MLHRLVMATVAAAALLVAVPSSSNAAEDVVYFNGKSGHAQWKSSGKVTSTRNTSLASAGFAYAYARVGTFEVHGDGPGVVQTYSRRQSRVECGWANRHHRDKVIPQRCWWRNG